MMSKMKHPIEQEELMAYLDGELATDRAVEAAAHLERCPECQELANELKMISQDLMGWEVEPSDCPGISTDIAVELEKQRKQTRKITNWRMWGLLVTPRRLAWGGGIAVVFIVVAGVSIWRRLSYEPSAGVQTRADHVLAGLVSPTPPSSGYVDTLTLRSQDSLKLRSPAQSGNDAGEGATEDQESESKPGVPEVPMIARTAGLTLTTKEFDKTRAALDEILKRHNGYIGELSVSAPSDAGRTLTATLRIPAPQLEPALAELKKLGRVENESQGGEEVTQQYVDLHARLENSKHTEQRLAEILRTRTGKLQDVLKVELEIDRVRGEIEQMQAERKELTKRVAFATLNTTVKEEYQAKLQGAPSSTGSRFRNAAVDGYNTVVEGLIDVCLFLLSSGPSLLIWAVILFFPARWLWKKVRAELTKNHAETA